MARVDQVGDSILGKSSLLHDTPFYCFDHHNFALFLCNQSIFLSLALAGWMFFL